MTLLYVALAAILGAAFGAASGGVALGLLLGAGIGLLCARTDAQARALEALRQEVARLRTELRRAVADGATQSEPTMAATPTPTPTPTPTAAAASARREDPRPAAPDQRPPAAGAPPAIEESAGGSAGEPDRGWAGETAALPGSPPSADELAPIRWLREWFTGGNTVVRVGVVLLFFGVAFLLRFLAEHARIPIELKLAAVAAGGVALLGLGWWLRARRPGYALTLQGGGIGVLFLVVFAGFRLYDLLPPGAAFALLVAIAAGAVALALLQDSLALAVLGVTGGFLAPLLASTGEGSHVALFGYYVVLNAGVAVASVLRPWKPLALVGFAFTYLVATAWGVLAYRPEHLASTLPFLGAFFAIYLGIVVARAWREPGPAAPWLDGTLVFGNPLVAFGLLAALLRDRPLVLAFGALGLAATYLGLAAVLLRSGREWLRPLVEAALGLGVAFLVVAVPLALDGRWSAVAWALQGAALAWIGVRQGRVLARAAGLLLLVAAGVAWAAAGWPDGTGPIAAGVPAAFAIALAALYAASRLQAGRATLRGFERPYEPLLLAWATLWWILAGAAQIEALVPFESRPDALLAWVALAAAGATALHRRVPIAGLRYAAPLLLLAMLLRALLAAAEGEAPLADGGWLAWPLAFAALAYALRGRDALAAATPAAAPAAVPSPSTAPPAAAGTAWLDAALHVAGALLLVGLAAWQGARAVADVRLGGAWPTLAFALAPLAALALLPRLLASGRWPFDRHRAAYAGTFAGTVAAALLAWTVFANLALDGDAAPLPYLPLANPLDLAIGAALLVIASWAWRTRGDADAPWGAVDPRATVAVLGGAAFLWFNGMLVRTLHHWAGVPLIASDLLASTLFQTTVSIAWTVLALALMWLATRRGLRVVWLVGAALLAIVVAKLFFVDLSRVGTVERIVSFLGVGVLMLVVGWLAPLPPAERRDTARAATLAIAITLALAVGVTSPVAMATVSTAGAVAVAAEARLPGPEAGALETTDFAAGRELVLPTAAPAYRVELPLEIYRALRRADLGDLRVFNAAGEEVPTWLQRPAGARREVGVEVALPLFPLPGDPAAALDALRVTLATAAGELRIRTPASPAQATRSRAYLVEVPREPAAAANDRGPPLVALVFDWAEDAATGAARVRVEASDDLAAWRTLRDAAPLANLRAGDTRLREARVEFAPTTARWWRVTWLDPPPFAFAAVRGVRSGASVEVARTTVEVPGRATTVDGAPGFEWDLGAALPVDRVDLRLRDPNSVAVLRFETRPDATAAWTPLASHGYYRLAGGEGELRGAPLAVEAPPHRHWRGFVTPPSGLGRAAPVLVVGWLPHEVAFLARGDGPFVLAYGSGRAGAPAARPGPLPDDATRPLPLATLGAARVLGGEAALAPAPRAIDWRTWTLWGVLALGVALLGAMAWRLSRRL